MILFILWVIEGMYVSGLYVRVYVWECMCVSDRVYVCDWGDSSEGVYIGLFMGVYRYGDILVCGGIYVIENVRLFVWEFIIVYEYICENVCI